MGSAILLGMRWESLLLQSSPNEILLLQSSLTGAFRRFSGKIGKKFQSETSSRPGAKPGLSTSKCQRINLCNGVNKLYKCSVSKRKVHKMVWHIKLAMRMGTGYRKSKERGTLRGNLYWECWDESLCMLWDPEAQRKHRGPTRHTRNVLRQQTCRPAQGGTLAPSSLR